MINPSLVLVQPRKTRPNEAERLLAWALRIKSNKQKQRSLTKYNVIWSLVLLIYMYFFGTCKHFATYSSCGCNFFCFWSKFEFAVAPCVTIFLQVSNDLDASIISGIHVNIDGDLESVTIKIEKAPDFESITVHALIITVCRPGMNIFTRPKQYWLTDHIITILY